MSKNLDLELADVKVNQLADRVNELRSLAVMLQQYLEDGSDTLTAQNATLTHDSAVVEQLCEQVGNALYHSAQVAETMRRLAWQSEDIQVWLKTFIEDVAAEAK